MRTLYSRPTRKIYRQHHIALLGLLIAYPALSCAAAVLPPPDLTSVNPPDKQNPHAMNAKARAEYWQGVYWTHMHHPRRAAQAWLVSAKLGDPEAQFNLGDAYYFATGVPKDLKLAAYWWHLSAQAGNAQAQNNLGYAYAHGEGVTENPQKAVYWWTKSAGQGDAYAELLLGLANYYGRGVSENHENANTWFIRSAHQNNPIAELALARDYAQGYGTAKNYSQAFHWFLKAAEQGTQPRSSAWVPAIMKVKESKRTS